MEATQYRLENQLDNEENRKEKKTNQLQDDIPYTVDLKNNFLVTIMGTLQRECERVSSERDRQTIPASVQRIWLRMKVF